MKAFIVLVSLIAFAGCSMVHDFGPASDYYTTHSVRGVNLFKIKSPVKYWYTRRNYYSKNISADDFVSFVGRGVPQSMGGWGANKITGAYERSGGGFDKESMRIDLHEGLHAIFDYGIDGDELLFESALKMLSTNNHSAFCEYYKNEGDSGACEKILFKGYICILTRKDTLGTSHTEVANFAFGKKDVEIKGRSEVRQDVRCPGFFKSTFGYILVYLSVQADTLANAKSAFHHRRPDFQKSLDSFEFVAPFSQKIPQGFSLKKQLNSVQDQWYRL